MFPSSFRPVWSDRMIDATLPEAKNHESYDGEIWKDEPKGRPDEAVPLDYIYPVPNCRIFRGVETWWVEQPRYLF